MNNTRWARPESLLEVYSWISCAFPGCAGGAGPGAPGHHAPGQQRRRINYGFVVHRFHHSLLADLRFHAALAGHGPRPERSADHDRRLSDRTRMATLALSVLAIVGVVFLTLGSLVIVTFQPLAAGK